MQFVGQHKLIEYEISEIAVAGKVGCWFKASCQFVRNICKITYGLSCCCRLLCVCVILRHMAMNAVVNYTDIMCWST